MLSKNKIKYINSLYNKKIMEKNKLFIVEGDHLVDEAYIKGLVVESYSIYDDGKSIIIDENDMRKICNTKSIVSRLAICKMKLSNKLEDKILLLDDIQDPGNLGTILRSARAFNFKTIVMSKNTVSIFNDKVIRSSQGAIFKLNFIKVDLIEFIKSNKEYKYYLTDVETGTNINDIDTLKYTKIGIILGNEGNGVSKDIKNLDIDRLNISMEDIESLNVSIAASIIMHKFYY